MRLLEEGIMTSTTNRIFNIIRAGQELRGRNQFPRGKIAIQSKEEGLRYQTYKNMCKEYRIHFLEGEGHAMSRRARDMHLPHGAWTFLVTYKVVGTSSRYINESFFEADYLRKINASL